MAASDVAMASDGDDRAFSDDLGDVMTATGSADTTLVGFSMGGDEVARYRMRHAGRHLRWCVIVSSGLPCMQKTDDEPHRTDAADFQETFKALPADRPKFFADFFSDIFGTELAGNPTTNEFAEWTQAIAIPANLKATLPKQTVGVLALS